VHCGDLQITFDQSYFTVAVLVAMNSYQSASGRHSDTGSYRQEGDKFGNIGGGG